MRQLLLRDCALNTPKGRREIIDAQTTTRQVFTGCFNEALLSRNTTRVNRKQNVANCLRYQMRDVEALIQNVTEEFPTGAFNDMLRGVNLANALSLCFNYHYDTVNIWRQCLHIRRCRERGTINNHVVKIPT